MLEYMPIKEQKNHSSDQINMLSSLPNINHEPRFRVKILASIKITKTVMTLLLERPTDFIFTPGQYIWLVLPESSVYYGIIDRRAYSITTSIDDNKIGLLINITESEFLQKVKSLKVGQEVDIIGPMGSAFIPPSEGAIMIAGGVGITPFLSILRSHQLDKLCMIAYSRKDNESLHFESELKKISEQYGYNIVLKKSGPQESDFNHICSKKCTEPIFICGSQGFVDFVTDILIGKGVSTTRMHYEENHPQTEASKKLEEMFSSFFYGDWSNNHQKLSGVSDLFLQATKQTSNHVILTDHDGRILFANQAAIDMTGYTFEEMQGQTPRLWGGLMQDSTYKKTWVSLKKGVAVKKAMMNRRRDGTLYTVIATITPILHKGVYIATEENITTLREIDRAKTEFVSIASHQLRTPLSIIKWYVEMLTSGDAGKLTSDQDKYLQEINKGNELMIELVNSLLDTSRLELGTFVVNRESTDIIQTVKDVIEEQRIKIDEKKQKLSFSAEKNIPTVQMDQKLLRMVAQNLLSNAIKYSPEKGEIKVNFSMKGSKDILITISDNGYGIPANQHDKIFSKFFRADNVRLKSTEGTGLGLYIVKLIIDNYGGKIWFESEENKGTTFYVSVPTKPTNNTLN